MPTIEQNYKSWNQTYNWTQEGDEWSQPWGSALHQWHTLILPRIYHYLPARHILEIAPGHGRWTQFLANHTETLSIIDLSETCIEHCQARFAEFNHIRYYVNDGKSLQQIEDSSVDFVFCFDSLVHAEYDVICVYLKEIQRILVPGGSAVIHHSNLAAVPQHNRKTRWNKFLKQLGVRIKTGLPHWRSVSVSADLVLAAAKEMHLPCTGQEIFKWIDTPYETDCISVFWNGNTDHHTKRMHNSQFQANIREASQLLDCYQKPA